MAEPRKARIDQIFQSTPERGDEPNTVRRSKGKEHYEKNIASVISCAKKIKRFFHSRTVSQTNAAASKEIPKPQISVHKSSNNSKSSLPKPPFIVPGRIIYNDRHLLQSIPQIKCPLTKKTVTRTGVVKVTFSQRGTSREAVGKIRPVKNVTKPTESTTVPCQCNKFIPPIGITVIPEKSVLSPPAIIVDDFCVSSARPSSNVSTQNPFITVDRRTLAQKPSSSLLNSQESSAPLMSYFLEDMDSLERKIYLEGESKPFENKHHNNQGVTARFAESNFENCDATTQGKHHEIIEIAQVYRNNEGTNKSKFEFTESEEECAGIQTESPSKSEVEEGPLNQNLHAKNNMEVAQQFQVQQVHQNKEDINKINFEVNDPTVQLASPYKAEVEEDAFQQNLHAEKMEIAQQLRAQIEEKKTDLDELCRLWDERLKLEKDIPDDKIGAVLSVIGQTQLLQRERFHQYAGLILKFENNSDEKKITKSDLEGFWEMILLQVTDVENKFTELDSLHREGWIRQETVAFQLKKTRKPKKKNEKKKKIGEFEVKSSGIRSHIASLRKKHVESNSLETCDFNFFFADHSSLLNPREVALVSSLDLYDKMGQVVQSAIERTNNEGFSTHRGIVLDSGITETPCYSSVMRRKKHKSENNTAFFSSPHQSPYHTDSPRQRSHSTNFILDQSLAPTSLSNRENVVPSSKLLEIPKIFSPTVKQCITRAGRISRSPDRFGQTEEKRISPYTEISKGPSPRLKLVTRSGRISQSPNRFGQAEEPKVSSYTPQSRIFQYSKPQQQNAETPEHVNNISINKEENNNDVNESFSITFPNYGGSN